MKEYLTSFDTHSEYQTYSQGGNMTLPNVSYCVGNNEVHFNPFVETRIVAKFNVTSTSNTTMIMYHGSVSQFNKIWIDGVEQQSVEAGYIFSTTGEHTVKYLLVDNTTIGSSAFSGCSSLTSAVIPDSVTTIDYGAFQGCTSLTSITIGNSVTSIGQDAFRNCTGLTSVTIPNSVTSIGQSAFAVCTGLTSVTIPNSVTSISNRAFYGCTSLSSVTVEATTPPSLGNNVFDSNGHGRRINVPSASVTTYKTASGWSSYSSAIQAIPTT